METLQVPGAAAPKEFGPLLSTRERARGERVFLVSTLVVCGLVALAGLGWAVSAPASKRSQAIVGGITAAGVAAGCFGSIRRLFRSVRFHEAGVVDTCFGKRAEYRYADAVGMNYSMTRRYVNGIYTGTELMLRLAMGDGRVLHMTTKHKERPKGLSVTLLAKQKTFEGEDEMDVVKDVIASYIAERLGAELAKGGPVGWCMNLRLNTQGVMPLNGKAKGAMVPWREITGATFERGGFFLFARGEDKAFVITPCAGYNFYPCLQLFQTFMEAAKGKRVA